MSKHQVKARDSRLRASWGGLRARMGEVRAIFAKARRGCGSIRLPSSDAQCKVGGCEASRRNCVLKLKDRYVVINESGVDLMQIAGMRFVQNGDASGWRFRFKALFQPVSNGSLAAALFPDYMNDCCHVRLLIQVKRFF
jgi:hypothetical protein